MSAASCGSWLLRQNPDIASLIRLTFCDDNEAPAQKPPTPCARFASYGWSPSPALRGRMTSEEPHRLAARAGLEAALGALAWNIDDVHRAVALAGDEQFVAAERHVHRLA